MRARTAALAIALAGLFGTACASSKVQGAADGGTTDVVNGSVDGPPPLTLPDAGEVATPPATAACAGESHHAQQTPMDLLLLVDTSGSMTESAGTRTKWDMVRQALHQFLADSRSSGLSVGLQFFPLAPVSACERNEDCGAIGSCQHRGVCQSPDGSAPITPCMGFANSCPAGQACRLLNVCGVSKAPCLELGKPCAGDDRDVCQARAGSCRMRPGGGPIGCERDAYATLAVPVSPLPAWAGALSLAIAAVEPVGDTPMTVAAEGALSALRRHATAQPGRKAGLVLVTDGLPTGCQPNDLNTVVASLAEGGRLTPPLSTHVIGVFPPADVATSRPALEQFATAGGTGEPFVLTAGEDLADRFFAVLGQIRGQALACEFPIPRPTVGMLDYGKVNVRFTGSRGPEELRYVESADRCDPTTGGWYYDVTPRMGTPAQAPSRVIVCEATCRRIRLEANGIVDVNVGCSTRID